MSHAYSVTFDNGKEFSEHKRITDAGIETYFDNVSNEQIEQIEFALNHRPRKTLGWYTPSEVMAGFYTVALAA
uniref:Putative transposase n=1 Tax=Acinetobacter baumannii TaxID=470 RepID=A0A125S0U9_ACIBA|nr:putative transposase [Acinetobacter baumannii]